MTLNDVYMMFSSDEKCRELLKRLRWPDGPKCLKCGDTGVFRLNTEKHLLYCRPCRFQFTVTSNTIFHDSHLPLLTWFAVTYLLCESKKGMSAKQIQRMFKTGYKTAWHLCHRIRAAMKATESQRPLLDGKVEMDETYIGGKQHTYSKAGFGDSNKQIVIGIRQRQGELRFFHAKDVKSGTLAKYIKENISEDVDVIYTDELNSYPGAMGDFKDRHKTIKHKEKIYVDGDIHTNTAESAFSLLKRGLIGTWHKLSAKHLHAYLAEMEFRFNRRNTDDIFLDTLRHMITADPMTFENLTHEPDPEFDRVSA